MGVKITPSPRPIEHISSAKTSLEFSGALPSLDSPSPLHILDHAAAAKIPLELSSCAAAGLTPLLNYEGAPEALAIVQRTTGEKPSKLDKPLSKQQQGLLNEALSFLDRLKAKIGPNGEAYHEFLGILNEFKEGKHRPFEVSRRVTLLFTFHGHNDLVEEMYKWTPWQHRFHLWRSSGAM